MIAVVLIGLEICSIQAVPTTRSKAAEKLKQESDCSKTYLNTYYNLDKNYNATSDGDINECAGTMESVLLEYNEIMMSLIEEDDEFAEETGCMMDKLRSFNTADYFLQHNTYSEDESMKSLRRLMAAFSAGSYINTKVSLASEICFPDKTFGESFEETFASEEISPVYNETVDDLGGLQLDYCQRQNLVDKIIFKLNLHKIVVNPKNIAVSELDCNKLYNEYFEEYSIALKDKFVSAMGPTAKEARCMANQIRIENYVGKNLRVWMLGELKISGEEKEAEKTDYIISMKDLYKKIMGCIETRSE